MTTYDVTASNTLQDRAKAVIPGGIPGHFGKFVRPTSPKFYSKSQGSRFWDIDGNEYVDYMCAFGPMVLGYNHPAVDEAALTQLKAGNTVSIASPILVDLAETLVDLVTAADWALFSKNGGDATAHAALVARAATGRQKIVKIKDGYHGVAPWMQATGSPGILPSDSEHIIEIPWNDVGALRHVIAQYPDDIGGFISAPYDHSLFTDNTMPADGYWQEVEALCRKNGIVIIIDEIRTGFRINLHGANIEYGFTPDLICFGKAMGNGYPIAALVGSDALKKAAEEVYFTGTHFFNAAPMAAARATLLELQKTDAIQKMTDYGDRLKTGLVSLASSHGYDLVVTGWPAMPFFRLADMHWKTHAAWIDECVKRGVYMLAFHNNFVSAAHSEADLELTLGRADDALKALGPASAQTYESLPA